MRNRLHRVAVVFRKVPSAELGLDVDPAAETVIRHDFASAVEENEMQLVEVAVTFAVHAVFHQEHRCDATRPGPENAKAAPLSIRTIGELYASPCHLRS